MKFLSSYTILIVEDETNVRESLEYILRSYGAQVESKCNGIEALEFLSQDSEKTIDLMITDIEMPFLNGVELLKKLHKLNLYVPTLVITGYGEKSLIQDLLRIGCEDYLDKPFSKQELKECLERIISKSKEQKPLKKTYSGTDLNQKIESINSTHKSITNYDAKKYNSVKIWNSSLEELGGDCFFIHQDSKHIYAVLADVAGHDMGASYYTIIVKTLFHQTCSQESSPVEFLSELEGLLPEIDDSKRMICVLYLKFEIATQKVQICSTGIPPVICTSPKKESFAIPKYIHPPLGVYPLTDIFQEEFILDDDSKIFIFSDGILNCTKVRRIQETNSLVDHKLITNWINETKDQDVETIINKIKSNTLRYCRHKQNDDILIVGIDLKES